jgi:O-succinylbenzoate synthase
MMSCAKSTASANFKTPSRVRESGVITQSNLANIANKVGPVSLDRIEVYRVSIPLVEPFRISSGEVLHKDAILVRLAHAGASGWGESSAMSGSFYSSETPDACWTELIERIVPAVYGRTFPSVAALDMCLRELSSNRFATVAVETAAWEMAACAASTSVRALLDIGRRAIPSGLAVGLYDSVDELLAALERLRPEQYARLKLKIKRGHDVELVRSVRARYPDMPLFVDANADYTLDDADVFTELDRFGLMMFEQPLGKGDIEGSAELQRRVRTPVCLDETIDSAAAARRAIAAGACRIVNLKLQRVGGITESLRIIDVCTESGTPMWMGTMPELGVGSAQALALVAHPAFVLPTDVEPSARWYMDDVLRPPIELDGNACIVTPEGFGWEYQVDPLKLDGWCTDRMVV